MKLTRSIKCLFLLLGIFAFPSVCFSENIQKQGANFATSEEIRVTLGINSNGVSWKLKINDIEIPTNENFEHSSKAIQLYHKDHPVKEIMHPTLKGQLCLNEGKNKISITFKLEDIDIFKKHPSARVYMNALPYDKYILEYKTPELKFGEIEGEFFVYKKMPENYKTILLKNKK